MKTGLVKALSALAVGGVAFSFATAAQATTVNFNSTTTIADSLTNPVVTYLSDGLSSPLTVGV